MNVNSPFGLFVVPPNEEVHGFSDTKVCDLTYLNYRCAGAISCHDNADIATDTANHDLMCVTVTVIGQFEYPIRFIGLIGLQPTIEPWDSKRRFNVRFNFHQRPTCLRAVVHRPPDRVTSRYNGYGRGCPCGHVAYFDSWLHWVISRAFFSEFLVLLSVGSGV